MVLYLRRPQCIGDLYKDEITKFLKDFIHFHISNEREERKILLWPLYFMPLPDVSQVQAAYFATSISHFQLCHILAKKKR
jgi:hypothetical protein